LDWRPRKRDKLTLSEVPLVKLRDVVKTYPTAAGDFLALKKITADFHLGEFVGIVGKSGAGKSTLVNMMTGVDHLTSGEVWVGDTPVHELDESEMALWRGRNIGVVYQSFELLPTLSLLDNVMLPMAEHMHKPPTRISGGQQQRVAIARALANDPPIIIADEPTGNLDTATAEDIFRLFDDLVVQGKTVILVTHDNSLAKRVTRVLRIADGEIVGEESVS
jgi:putative ABC transport system ATP-binding protein